MYKTLSDKAGRDKDYPARQHRINMLGRVLDGSLYDGLQYPFSQERQDGTQEYIPIFERRPSARYRLCATVVEDSVSLLFGDARFPGAVCEDEETREGLSDIIADCGLAGVMIDAAMKGSVGSVCLWLRILKGRVFVKPLVTEYLTPAFDPQEPDKLVRVIEKYKVPGRELRTNGYTIADDDLGATFWFERQWDNTAEWWFVPIKVADAANGKNAATDIGRTTQHGLGFCPMVWIKNLPGGDDIDGSSTMVREAIYTQIEIDYLLSQNARGFAMRPTPRC